MRASAILRAVSAAAPLVLASGAHGQTTIADLAPEESFLIVSVPDWAEMEGAFGRTPLGALWRDREINEFLERATAEPAEQVREALAEIDTELGDLETPVGAVGMAMYFVPGEPMPRGLAMADYGDRAEGMRAVIDRLLEKGVEDDLILVDEEEHAGATILTITPVHEEEEGDEGEAVGGDEEEMDWDEADWEEPDPIGDFLGQVESFTLAIREGTFLLSADSEAVDRALEVLGGEGMASAAQAKGYLDARAQLPEELDAFMVLRTGELIGLLAEQATEGAAMIMPGGFDAGRVFEAIGLSGVEALSFGMRFDTQEASLEQTVAVLAGEPKGLLALMLSQPAPLDPPPFIGADAAEYSQYSFDFAGLLGTAREVIATLPEEMREEADVRFEQGLVPMFGPLVESLGPQVYVTKSYMKPLEATSTRAFAAIPTKDEAILNNLLATLPMLQGAQVQGNMIYELQMGDLGLPMPAAAIGVGSGHVLIGGREDVQDALRQAANPEGPRLSGEERYRRAVAALHDPGLWFGYREFAPTYEWMRWQMENMEQVQRAELEQMGMSAEDIDEAIGYMADSVPAWAKDLPATDLLSEYIGDISFELHAAPDGMRGRWLLLRPRER